MKRRWLLAGLLMSILGLTGGAHGALGQAFEQRVSPFPVRDTTGEAYAFPFLGGLNTPRPQLVDLDADGDLDLFLQERRNRIIHFENTGTPTAPSFRWRTDHFQGLEVGAWFRFGNLDGKGPLDLLAEEPTSNIRYYRNVGTSGTPDFERVDGPLRDADGAPIPADRQNIPLLAALDCAGPPDLLLGTLNGRLRYYEHIGTRDEGIPAFRKEADRYQGVCVGPPSVCGGRSSPQNFGSAPRHGANALTSGDLGGDGDPDLLWGDFFSQSLYLIENTGSCEAPVLQREADTFPPSDPVQTSGYNVPSLADLDGDGDLDLLVGVLGGSGTGSSAVANLLQYENQGTDAQPDYTLRTRQFVSTLDVGGVSAPALVDLDDDGDRDLVVGNNQAPGGDAARLHHVENVGTPTAPIFRRRTSRLLPKRTDGFNFAPAFADIDSDGDPDLFVGTFSGTIRFYRNIGTDQSPQFGRAPEGDLTLPQGNYATPALVDIDSDGDLDLFAGSSGAEGTVAFYRNEGTPQQPAFTLVTDTYADLRAGKSRTHPAFVDRDGDGAPDLYLGTNAGLSVYRNTGSPQSAEFAPQADSLAVPLRPLVAPTLADVDGDNRVDLMTGGDGGGVKFFAGQEAPAGPSVPPGAGVRAAPNPFADRTTLTFSIEEAAPVSLSVYDLLGRRVSVLLDRRLGPAEYTEIFRGTGRASGVYLYVLSVNGRVRDRGRLIHVR